MKKKKATGKGSATGNESATMKEKKRRKGTRAQEEEREKIMKRGRGLGCKKQYSPVQITLSTYESTLEKVTKEFWINFNWN